MPQPVITISLPCYGRPARTVRAINSILAQTRNNYELLITGDGCDNFERPSFLSLLKFVKRVAEERGNIVTYNNNEVHTGGYGYQIRNSHIQTAKGIFFMFMGNDDVLHPRHLEDKLKYIEHTLYDWIYYDTEVEPNQAPRNAQLQPGMIGHSEIMARTVYLRKMPPHTDQYGHDWELVKAMMDGTVAYIKAAGAPQTYIVKSIPGREEQGID